MNRVRWGLFVGILAMVVIGLQWKFPALHPVYQYLPGRQYTDIQKNSTKAYLNDIRRDTVVLKDISGELRILDRSDFIEQDQSFISRCGFVDFGLRLFPWVLLLFGVGLALGRKAGLMGLPVWALGSTLLFGLSFYQLKQWPDSWLIEDALVQPPDRDVLENAKPIELSVPGETIKVVPEQSLQMHGLIVALDTGPGWKSYWQQLMGDALDVRGIALFWGDELKTRDFSGMQFQFNETVLGINANQHSLPTPQNMHVFKIWHAQPSTRGVTPLHWGDQIFVKGFLIPASKQSGLPRREFHEYDLIRHAVDLCITEIQVIRESHPVSRRLHRYSFFSSVLSWLLLGAYVLLQLVLDSYRLRHRLPTHKPKFQDPDDWSDQVGNEDGPRYIPRS